MVLNRVKGHTGFKAVNLFAGGGGITVGLKRAGFKAIGAVKPEPNALAKLMMSA